MGAPPLRSCRLLPVLLCSSGLFCTHCSNCLCTISPRVVWNVCFPFLRYPVERHCTLLLPLCIPCYLSAGSHCFQRFLSFACRSPFSGYSGCLGSALPPLGVLWLRLTSACSARLSYITAVTPFGAFHADLPGYHTFLSLHLPAAFIPHDSVQLLGFGLLGSLTLMCDLICGFCSSGQRFARG